MTEIAAVIPQENDVVKRAQLWAYAVVATDGAVRCEELKEDKRLACEEGVGELIPYKMMAKGLCDRFKTGSLIWKSCVAVRERNCLSWKEPIKKSCQVFDRAMSVSSRIDMVQDVYNEYNSIMQSEEEKDRVFQTELKRVSLVDLAKSFGVISGYFEQHPDQRKNTCQNFFNAYHVGADFKDEYFICEVLFSDDPVKVARDIDRDLTAYRLAQVGKDKKGCVMIKHPALREACGR
ncbi:MAG: hypothetical protein WCI27_06860 [Candidatus Omnitrophota bacterium]